jgi:predicted AAA+ superfamily ATPase
MAVSNRDRVGKAFEQLAEGLEPYVDRRMQRFHPSKDGWFDHWVNSGQQGVSSEAHLQDPAILLRVMADFWPQAFRQELPSNVRNVVFSLRNRRNDWAHNKPFQFDDTYRVLDEVEQLLIAVDAPQADAVGAEKDEYMRAKYAVEAKKAGGDIAGVAGPVKGLRPWREIAEPHDDVAQGRFSMAEFAADLRAVRLGTGAAEYVEPIEFFRRTYLTEGLSQLLVGAAGRVTGGAGAPVVDLQTTFGGGKTHSMIALYHLFSGTPLSDMPAELRAVLADGGIETVPALPRAVLVGTALKPGQPEVKDDGTEVRTLWGELAWQLGGREAYDLVAGSDRTATSPGDALDDVFAFVGPCLILIDEWVAYARMLFGDETLPGGTFDTHFTFAQALTEAVKRSPGVLLVVSIPASEPAAKPSSTDDDESPESWGSEVELGGFGGRESLARLKSVIGRLESSWRPASAEESFEIVRRRLFKPIPEDRLGDRDAVVQAFMDYYRKQAAELPEEVRSPRYHDQMRQAYPIHPELFARLYQDWSTLERFQRTRGVLRLMASVISALWEAGDQSPMIMPASLPLELSSVNLELLRHLEDSFKPVLDADIDGEDSTSRQIDREFPNLGKYQATRRVARAVFFGSAPTLKSANRGVETQRVRLACALPGETIETYGDALKRLSDRASYLYVEGSRCWFDTRQSVVRQAQEAAEQLRSQRLDEVHAELIERLRAACRDRGEFAGVHVAPATSEDVSDEDVMRLVVLAPDLHYIQKSDSCPARTAMGEMLSRRGGNARQRRNMIVFLAPDSQNIEQLEIAASEYLAWKRIVDDADALNLDKTQEKQAKERRDRAEKTMEVRIGETYRWLLVPRQSTEAGAPVEMTEHKLDGAATLAVRASERLRKEGTLYVQYPPVLLRHLLDGVLAGEWADGHVTVGRLWEVFTQYPYLPKLRDRKVLETTVGQGPGSMTWQTEGFAVADLFADVRYGGLTVGSMALTVNPETLVVRPDIAIVQVEADARAVAAAEPTPGAGGPAGGTGSGAGVGDGSQDGGGQPGTAGDGTTAASPPTRFQGAVTIDAVRAVKQFAQIADEVLVNLQAEGELEVVIEVRATSAGGFSDSTVRTVTENAKVLKFDPGFGFETD